MANGQQKAEENLATFDVWAASQTNDDFASIINRGQLNRTEIAKACAFSKSALRQNPRIKKALELLENRLREAAVLPPKTDEAKDKEGKPVEYDQSKTKRIQDSKKLNKLEAENMQLQAENEKLEQENTELKHKLVRYSAVNNVIAELGMLPE